MVERIGGEFLNFSMSLGLDSINVVAVVGKSLTIQQNIDFPCKTHDVLLEIFDRRGCFGGIIVFCKCHWTFLNFIVS